MRNCKPEAAQSLRARVSTPHLDGGQVGVGEVDVGVDVMPEHVLVVPCADGAAREPVKGELADDLPHGAAADGAVARVVHDVQQRQRLQHAEQRGEREARGPRPRAGVGGQHVRRVHGDKDGGGERHDGQHAQQAAERAARVLPRARKVRAQARLDGGVEAARLGREARQLRGPAQHANLHARQLLARARLVEDVVHAEEVRHVAPRRQRQHRRAAGVALLKVGQVQHLLCEQREGGAEEAQARTWLARRAPGNARRR